MATLSWALSKPPQTRQRSWYSSLLIFVRIPSAIWPELASILADKDIHMQMQLLAIEDFWYSSNLVTIYNGNVYALLYTCSLFYVSCMHHTVLFRRFQIPMFGYFVLSLSFILHDFTYKFPLFDQTSFCFCKPYIKLQGWIAWLLTSAILSVCLPDWL